MSRDVVPTIKQNPTCNFTVTATEKPYVGIQHVNFEQRGDDGEVPHIGVMNSGLSEVTTLIQVKYLLDGKAYLTGSQNLLLGPGQARGIWLSNPNLPISEIKIGKVILAIEINISYPLVGSTTPASHRESWVYDHRSKMFLLSQLR